MTAQTIHRPGYTTTSTPERFAYNICRTLQEPMPGTAETIAEIEDCMARANVTFTEELRELAYSGDMAAFMRHYPRNK